MIDATTVTVGDRVIREQKDGTLSPPRRGAITRCYASVPNGRGESIPLFDVLWDDTKLTDVGYFAHSLTREPLVVGAVRNL